MNSTPTDPVVSPGSAPPPATGPAAYGNRWSRGGSSDMTAILFLLLCLFILFVVAARITVFWRGTRDSLGNSMGAPNDPSTKSRTQEDIEKDLVMKEVISPSDDTMAPKESTEKSSRMAKSNIFLLPGAEELEACPICLSGYKDGDRICFSRNENCSHYFHAECGIAWMAKHSECPICRAEYLLHDNSLEEGTRKSSDVQPASETS